MPVVPATEEAIAKAAQALARGDIVAFPTETVYGLGANALDAHAVAKVFAAKERPRFNPLIVHVPDLAAAETYAVFNDTARKLAEAFWPGPLSLVLPKRADSGIADLVTAGLDTIALRAPDHPVAQALLAEAKLPIAAPSANRSGRDQPDHGGPCRGRAWRPSRHDPRRRPLPARHRVDGDRRGGRRAGPCCASAPCRARPSRPCSGSRFRSRSEDARDRLAGAARTPLRARHTPLRLEATDVAPDEALLAFGRDAPHGARRHHQSQRERRSRRSGGQPIRGAASSSIECRRHRPLP